MKLKDYQEIAIKDLLEKAKKLLVVSGSKKLVFKAPAGSGKTIMMAEFLKRLVDDREVKNHSVLFGRLRDNYIRKVKRN